MGNRLVNGLLILFLLTISTYSSGKQKNFKENSLLITIRIELDKKIYDFSDYGEPPQIAVWLEDTERSEIRTVYVTRRTAENDWYGKTECPVSLPFWQSRKKKSSLPDGISGATEKELITRTIQVNQYREFFIFIEVNVAGDYNRNFPANFDDGSPDPQGNGQPSLIYRGKIRAIRGEKASPVIIGRSLQLDTVEDVINDLKGMTSALKIISKIEVFIK